MPLASRSLLELNFCCGSEVEIDIQVARLQASPFAAYLQVNTPDSRATTGLWLYVPGKTPVHVSVMHAAAALDVFIASTGWCTTEIQAPTFTFVHVATHKRDREIAAAVSAAPWPVRRHFTLLENVGGLTMQKEVCQQWKIEKRLTHLLAFWEAGKTLRKGQEFFDIATPPVELRVLRIQRCGHGMCAAPASLAISAQVQC